ncbi:hypothetical protein ACVWZK_009119 [Bradyrhizobium sp. GM0.4]
MPFICDGLECGHRAFHVLPERHVDDHVTRLRTAGIDLEAAQRSGQLEIALSQDTYSRNGRFDKEDVLDLIQQVLGNGAALGFPLTRMIAHAETALDTWVSRNDWAEFEMLLNGVLSNFDDAVICTFDVNLLNTSLGDRHSAHASCRRDGGCSRRKLVLHQPRGFPSRGDRAHVGLSRIEDKALEFRRSEAPLPLASPSGCAAFNASFNFFEIH